VGNSLGGNLTMALLMELHQRNSLKKPNRVALIDPYWSFSLDANRVHFPYNYTNAYTLAAEAARISRDNYRIAIDYFRTSIAGSIGTNEDLIKYTAFSHFGTDYTWNPLNKHTVPVRQYFWSFQFAPPAEWIRPNITQPFTPTGNTASSASTADSRILDMMRDDKYWNHIEGRSTLSPEDDIFEIRDGLY
jgi:hypothetical protein